MSQNSAPHALVLDLDTGKIGNALVRLGLLARQLGHAHVSGSLKPYCNHPELVSPEVRFIYDIIIRSTPEVIDRWYGGENIAIGMIAASAASLLEDPAS